MLNRGHVGGKAVLLQLETVNVPFIFILVNPSKTAPNYILLYQVSVAHANAMALNKPEIDDVTAFTKNTVKWVGNRICL